MTLKNKHIFYPLESNSGHPIFESQFGAKFEFFVLEHDIIRVIVLPSGTMEQRKTWSICPAGDDVALQGRDRYCLDGYSLPPFESSLNHHSFSLWTPLVRMTFNLDGGFIKWEIKQHHEWVAVANDRSTQAYNFGNWDGRIYHYLERHKGEMYLGLGERAGQLNRAGQRYEMRNIDAMGYSAKYTDPLYKHIPFYITWIPEKQLGFGLFYDNVSDCFFDMGRELDNYHGPYRYYSAASGDLDYYFIASPTSPIEATKKFTWLTGRPAYMPKWSLGYSGSTMSYTDAPNASEQMQNFISACEGHDILCDSFHLSSGYTSIGKKRYVFNWNREKFPDIRDFVDSYLQSGVRLCANIKPCFLVDHPHYEYLKKAGFFIQDKLGNPLLVQFWDELGAYLDFTNENAVNWWKQQVKNTLLGYGIAATWNDNNEYEIWSTDAVANGFGEEISAHKIKVLQTMLMMKASRDAQREYAPNERPFLVSRSGGAGMQRYVQTWSGDNYTSWETLKFNIQMGLGLSLSGVSNAGHDIGGFAGPAPNSELFLRWIEFGIFLPRFSIHSWNDDSSINEPWMYPEITEKVSKLIKLRAVLTPYLYDLMAKANQYFEPSTLPTLAAFPDDKNCYLENDDMLLGQAVLVTPVVHQDERIRHVYLPKGQRWAHFQTGDIYEGGISISVAAPLGAPNFFIRESFGIPVNLSHPSFSKPSDQRGFYIFPPQHGEAFLISCVEDDGVTEAWRDGGRGRWEIHVSVLNQVASVSVGFSGDRTFASEFLELRFPSMTSCEYRFIHAAVCDQWQESGWACFQLRVQPS